MKALLSILLLGAFALHADDASKLYTSCAGCHGVKGEKVALTSSLIINSLSHEEIEKALRGYKTGTYGREKRAIMRAQVARLDDAQIAKLATYITSFK